VRGEDKLQILVAKRLENVLGLEAFPHKHLEAIVSLHKGHNEDMYQRFCPKCNILQHTAVIQNWMLTSMVHTTHTTPKEVKHD
jgi:hypothetical protein